MTTPTLLDAARRMLQEGETAPGWGQYHGDNGWSCTYCDNHEVNPYELDELADYRHADDCPVPIFRAAIASEEERQEIIEGLMAAAREARRQLFLTDTLPRLDGEDSDYAHAVDNILWGEVLDSWGRRSDTPNVNRTLAAALARYDAMKEDDRA